MIDVLKKICTVLWFGVLLFSGGVVFALDGESVIAVGDQLHITLAEDPSFVYQGPVDMSGKVQLPYVGEYKLVGLSPQNVESALSSLLEASYYFKATLTIRIVGHGPASIYVYGAVKEPGVLELPTAGEISIPQALAAVKGLTSWADADNCYIIRRSDAGEEQRIEVNVREQFSGTSEGAAVMLLSHDEFFVPSLNGSSDGGGLLTNDELEVIVVGQVGSPGVIRFAPGEEATLMRAVFKAGGLTRFAKGTAIKLIRYSGTDRKVELVDLDIVIEEGFLEEDRVLLPGDMVIVPQKLINF